MKSKRKNQQIPLIFRPLLDTDNDTSSRDSKHLILAGSFCSIIFIFALMGASYFYFSNYISSAVTVEAVVIDVEEAGCYRCDVSYAFEIFTDTGKEIIQGDDVTSNDMEMPSINDPIMIIYSANNPSRNILYDTLYPIHEVLLVLIGYAFFTTLGLYLLFGGFALRRFANQPKIKNDTVTDLES